MKGTHEQRTWRLFKPYFKQYKHLCKEIKFKAGTFVVRNGILEAPQISHPYTAVPLTYIKSGSVAIIQNGIAIKHYSAGECFGLFETACYLTDINSERIGRWDVQVSIDAVLLVSTEAFLEKIHPFTKNILIEAARANPVAKPLSRLPLLDWFAKVYAMQPQKDIMIVYHSHILHSSLELIKHLAYIAGPESTFVLEKPYSTLHQAFSKAAEGGVKTYQMKIDRSMSYEYSVKRNVDFFWREIQEYVRVNQTKEIIVISDGADVLLSPVIRELQDIKIIGIEQTQRGLSRLQKANLFFPVVSIAQTKSKKNYESPFIAAAALAKIDAASLLNRTYRYGIVGAGSIGKEIIRGLNLHGITPLVYDPIKTSSLDDFQAQSLEYLVQNSDIIIGTTGTDSLRGMYIERIKGKKIFISTSSSNVEFDYLFDLAKTYANSFEDIRLRISSTFSAIVLNGGYPINFDREVEWESFNDIQLTRALIYASVYEAINRKSTKAKIKCLHNALEKEVTNKWLLLR